jgi:uncharacterized protein
MNDYVISRHGVTFDRERLADFCHRRGIRKLALFGSILRDDFGPESDIDVLVEFFPGQRVNLLDMVDMEEELSAIIGRKVDLKTAEDLSRYFRDEVVAQAKILYGK